MKGLGRAIGVSLGVSIAVGAAVAAVVVLVHPSEGHPLFPRLSAAVLGQAATIGLLASVVVSVPAGVLGGFLADAMMRRHKTMSMGQWLGRGAAVGCGIGAGSSLLCGLVMSGFDVSTDPTVLFYVLVGAICGALCGIIMGGWCSFRGSRTP